jgi:hypothetical protein
MKVHAAAKIGELLAYLLLASGILLKYAKPLSVIYKNLYTN